MLATPEALSHRAGVPIASGHGGHRRGARIRSWLAVALRKEGTLLGVINVHRREVRPFSEKQIALLQNFAAQAVIAIENARLLDAIRQRQAELRVTFDNMGDGVVMFDQALRLAAWNKATSRSCFLDLPDEVLAARPTYSEYLHILAERGEFGTGDVEEELNRRLAHADEELRFERTRPDGRVLEVRRNAVAGGGFVLIYSDITERKRAEAEIRAARDAAEKALGELKTTQASLIQAEKMASLGQLTAGIAHEIKNPLNFVNNFAHLSVELLEELKEIAGPALDALDEDKRADLRRHDGDADRQSRQDRRARAPRRQHRQIDAGTFARHDRRAARGRCQRPRRGVAEPRLSRRPCAGPDLQHHARTRFRPQGGWKPIEGFWCRRTSPGCSST